MKGEQPPVMAFVRHCHILAPTAANKLVRLLLIVCFVFFFFTQWEAGKSTASDKINN